MRMTDTIRSTLVLAPRRNINNKYSAGCRSAVVLFLCLSLAEKSFNSEAPREFRSGEDNFSHVAIQWFSEVRSRTKSSVDARIAARFNHSDFAVTQVSAVPLENYDIVDKKCGVGLPI